MPPRIAQSWYKVRLSFYSNPCFTHYSIGLLQVMTSMNVERIRCRPLSVKSRAVIACDIGRRIYMESFYRLHNIWGLLKISLILVNRNYVLGNL